MIVEIAAPRSLDNYAVMRRAVLASGATGLLCRGNRTVQSAVLELSRDTGIPVTTSTPCDRLIAFVSDFPPRNILDVIADAWTRKVKITLVDMRTLCALDWNCEG